MVGSDADRDPVVRELREQIAAVDHELVKAVNRRVALVRRLKQHKAEHGLDFVDRAQEERLVERLEDVNPGPISADSLRELYRTLLEFTKREA